MNNVEKQLSIIIPMFKVAPCVERCLKSLANQDIPFEDYEIICINDGSPDNCSEIVRELQKEIPNIILLEQENQGVSMARNNGISIAKGKFLLMIDPDDYVVPNCFKYSLHKMDENKLDVLYSAFEIFDQNENSIWRTDYSILEKNIDSGHKGYTALRGPKIIDPDRSWAIFYSRNLFQKYNIEYPKDVPYLEDGLFLAKVFAVAKRVGYSNKDFYQRTTRAGSATNSDLFFSEKAINGFIKAAVELKEFQLNNNFTKLEKEFLNQPIAKFTILTVTPYADRSEFNKLNNRRKELVKIGIIPLNDVNMNKNYTSLANAINASSISFYLQWKFKKLSRVVKRKM